MKGKWFLGLILLLTIPSLRASVVFKDHFAYPDGPLVEVAEGKWKTHSGTAGQAAVVSGRVQLSQRQSEDVNAPFAGGTIAATNATALYASFKIAFSALPTGVNGGYFAHFKDPMATTGFRCRIFALTNGAAAGQFRLGIASAASAATTVFPRDLNLQTGYRVVCRMILDNNVCTLWVDPRREADANVVSTDEGTPKAAVAFAFRQSLSSGSGMGELTVDDLAVATTFGETQVACVPVELLGPADQDVAAGQDALFEVAASGTEPLSYQWFWDGAELPEATSSRLVLRSVTPEQAGFYQVAVSNCDGTVTSTAAFLTVEPKVFAVAISRSDRPVIQLHWAAGPDDSYSVWAGDSFGAGLSELISGMMFPDGSGLYEEALQPVVTRFFQVCSP